MNNEFYSKLLRFISEEREAFNTLVATDNTLGLNVSSDDIINYLEFNGNSNIFNVPLLGKIIVTEGDVLSTLGIIHDIMNYQGEFTLYINKDNAGTNSYLVSRANMIYKELGLNLKITIDYSDNYNKYLNDLVSLVGSEKFVNTASMDFSNANKIIV